MFPGMLTIYETWLGNKYVRQKHWNYIRISVVLYLSLIHDLSLSSLALSRDPSPNPWCYTSTTQLSSQSSSDPPQHAVVPQEEETS